MSWKSTLLGSILALGAQTALANKSLPCPTTGPLHDTLWLIQWDTRQKIENRLRNIDSEKKHQVVVVTVKNIEEYGFDSIEQMANQIGMGCKVGYRWENTWVVVLYTQVPPRYRIENANTERYITDVQSGRILTHSKSDWICRKEDVSCRLDDITWEIDKLIRKEFGDKQAVQQIQWAIAKNDEVQSTKDMNEFIWNLWIGTVVIVVLWWWVWWTIQWVSVINRRNRRKGLKREILELFTRLQIEKQKFPVWFHGQYIKSAETIITEMHQYNDDQLDRISESERFTRSYEGNIRFVRQSIVSWQVEFLMIQEKLNGEMDRLREQKNLVSQMNACLLSEWFVFPIVQISEIVMADNPADSIVRIQKELHLLSQSKSLLEDIPRYYLSAQWFDSKLQSSYKVLDTEYKALSSQYKEIFGTVPTIDITAIAQQVTELIAKFQEVYAKKDIVEIRNIIARGDTVMSPMNRVNHTMREKINWYNSVPGEIAHRERQLSSLKPDRKYISDANSYAQKTGRSDFLNYDLRNTVNMLQELLWTIRNLYSQKQGLEKLYDEFSKFDSEYIQAQKYMWLGAALATIIAIEMAEEFRKQIEAKKRKRDEEDEEERRRRRREQDEEDARKRRDDDARNSSSSSSSSNNWDSWGGGWFSGGWATSD
jgi:uncharacterized membrane protein YgcG